MPADGRAMWPWVWCSLGWQWLCMHSIFNDSLVCPTPNKIWGEVQLSHKSTGYIIECSFGLLKWKFPVLHSEVKMTPERVCTIVAACFVLHNIAIKLWEPEVDCSFRDERLWHSWPISKTGLNAHYTNLLLNWLEELCSAFTLLKFFRNYKQINWNQFSISLSFYWWWHIT